MTEIIAQFTDTEDNMTSFVTVGHRGFHVSLRDDDSGDMVPVALAFPVKEDAINKAKEIANVG